MEAWLSGNGCVPIHNLMEDAATAEISRSQIWQWTHHRVKTTSGKTITPELTRSILEEEAGKMVAAAKGKNLIREAQQYLEKTVLGGEYAEFLTTQCYDFLVSKNSKM